MKNLPIGISTLATIVEESMVYVDKTAFVHQLAATPGRYFLSRPRRFGKSLFLDTLKSLFEGREELFCGLYIHDKWDWQRRHPVIKIDFGNGGIHSLADLETHVQAFLQQPYQDFDITMPENSLPAGLLLRDLIIRSSRRSGSKVVVLVDEYDKPLLDNIENTAVQDEIRNGLRDLYSVIKEQDANLQFVFLTGVSKFAKVSIFSGINNLEDLTLDAAFAACCGYTEADLTRCFGEHLAGVDRELLQHWYNGYNFLGETVYNPYDILLFISKGHSYRTYWFETGTPEFLMKLFRRRRYFLPQLEGIEVGEEILSSFELDNIEPTTLLFQTGYLTIKSTETRRGRLVFVLGFPNYEVKTAFHEHLIQTYTDLTVGKLHYQDGVYDCLKDADLAGLEGVIKRLFAAIGYRNFTQNDISRFEGYYASVLYAFFSAIDCTVIGEDINNQGQADLTVQLGDNIYVMEIKVVEAAMAGAAGTNAAPGGTTTGANSGGANLALAQVTAKGYAVKYRGLPGKRVFEVGLVFGKAERSLVQYAWRSAD